MNDTKIPDTEFKRLIEQVVTETLDQIAAKRAKMNGRLAYPMAEPVRPSAHGGTCPSECPDSNAMNNDRQARIRPILSRSELPTGVELAKRLERTSCPRRSKGPKLAPRKPV